MPSRSRRGGGKAKGGKAKGGKAGAGDAAPAPRGGQGKPLAGPVRALCALSLALCAAEAWALWTAGGPRAAGCGSPADLPLDDGRVHADALVAPEAGDARVWVAWRLAAQAALSALAASQFGAAGPRAMPHEARGLAAVVAALSLGTAGVALERAGLAYSLPKSHPIAPFVYSNAVWVHALALAACAVAACARGLKRASGRAAAPPPGAPASAYVPHWAAAVRLTGAALVHVTAWAATHAAVLAVRAFSSLDAWCDEAAAKQMHGATYWAALLFNLSLAELLVASHRADLFLARRRAGLEPPAAGAGGAGDGGGLKLD